ncbi:WXG100 family type VII secretion target [Gordonia amicalis]|uniref:WXG100 family type VII secretion target n=1 Tax=Gordonia amicalis TaxID=89053 RepID=UPI0037BE75F3
MSAKNYSRTLSDELAKVARDVDDLLHVWRSGSATAYGESWTELKDVVHMIIDDLDLIGDQIASAADTYKKTDCDVAQPLLRLP